MPADAVAPLFIRPAVPADADELETIFYFAHLDAGLKADLSLDQMKLLMRILDDAALGDFMDIEPSFIHRSDRALFVAVSPNNEPFGMTAVTRLNDDSAEIQRVAVDPTRQGAGAAKALMRQCIEHAVARWQTRYLELWTLAHMTSAISFYRKTGFVETGQPSDYPAILEPLHFRIELAAMPPAS